MISPNEMIRVERMVEVRMRAYIFSMSPSKSCTVITHRSFDTIKIIEEYLKVGEKIKLKMRREKEFCLIFKMCNRAIIYSGVR